MNSKNLIDCLIVLKELKIKSSLDYSRVADLFGLDIIEEKQEIELIDRAQDKVEVSPDKPSEKFEHKNIRRDETKPASPKPVEEFGEPLKSGINRIKRTKPLTPSFSSSVDSIATESIDFKEFFPKIESLFQPKLRRQTLFGMGAVYAEKGCVDEKKLIKEISKKKPLLKIPKRMKPFIFNRIQLLLDVSEAMDPFLEDIDILEVELQDVLGNSKIEKLYFHSCPLRGVGKDASEWHDYRENFFPNQGTKVICVSNLGHGYESSTESATNPVEWNQFLDMLKRTSSSLTILTPYNLSVVQKVFFKQLNVIYWDRKTTPSKILRQM